MQVGGEQGLPAESKVKLVLDMVEVCAIAGGVRRGEAVSFASSLPPRSSVSFSEPRCGKKKEISLSLNRNKKK